MSIDRIASVQAIYAAFGAGDIPAIQSQVADNTHWDFNGARAEVPWHQPASGRAGVARFLQTFMESVEVQRFEPREFIHSGEHVIVEIRLQYKVRSTGRQVAEDQLHWWTFDEADKVARLRHFEDTAQVLAAVKPT
jgi:uncharacterized protein